MSVYYNKHLNLYGKSFGKQDYNPDKKLHEPKKQEYNSNIAWLAIDQNNYWSNFGSIPEQNGRYLMLESKTAGTATAMHLEAGIPCENMYIVSRNTKFTGGTCNTYTGELDDFLEDYDVGYDGCNSFDGMVLDYCCEWNDGVKDTLNTIFERELLEEISFLSVTFSHIRQKGSDLLYDGTLDAVMLAIPHIAFKHGYRAHVSEPFRNGRNVVSLFYKVIKPKMVSDKVHGLKRTRDNPNPLSWMTRLYKKR